MVNSSPSSLLHTLHNFKKKLQRVLTSAIQVEPSVKGKFPTGGQILRNIEIQETNKPKFKYMDELNKLYK